MEEQFVTLWTWHSPPEYVGLFQVATKDPHIRLEGIYREPLADLLVRMCRYGCRFCICDDPCGCQPPCGGHPGPEFCPDSAWRHVYFIPAIFVPTFPGFADVDKMFLIMHPMADPPPLLDLDGGDRLCGVPPVYSLITTRNIPPRGIEKGLRNE